MTEHDDDQTTLDALQQGWQKLDDLHPVYTPDLQWFQSQVATAQKQLRRRLLKDLLLFWLLAAVLLTLTLLLFTAQRSLYYLLQGLAILVPILLLLLQSRKRVDTR